MKSTPNLVSAQGGGGHHSSNSQWRGKKLSITQRVLMNVKKKIGNDAYVDGAGKIGNDVYVANYDHANNYGYVSVEHDDHSAETHCTFNN